MVRGGSQPDAARRAGAGVRGDAPRDGVVELRGGRGPAQPAVQRHEEGQGPVGGGGPGAVDAGQNERRLVRLGWAGGSRSGNRDGRVGVKALWSGSGEGTRDGAVCGEGSSQGESAGGLLQILEDRLLLVPQRDRYHPQALQRAVGGERRRQPPRPARRDYVAREVERA
jgi:hypothetical protein